MAVIGAGAAGLFAALSARGAVGPDGSFVLPESATPGVLLIDGKARPGRKILISGGGRCNVTNTDVGKDDYVSKRPNVVRNVLHEFPVEKVCAFFASRGVELVPEAMGKLFPRSDKSRDVLNALHSAATEAGVEFDFGTPVERIEPAEGGFVVDGVLSARSVVLATGGLSVPQTGSTGFGLELARELGHAIVATVPSLTPILAVEGEAWAGLTVPCTIFAEDERGRVRAASTGSLMFTHHGVTGPAALDLSGALERAWVDGENLSVFIDLWGPSDPFGEFGVHLKGRKLPGACLRPTLRPTDPAEVERELTARTKTHGRMALGTHFSQRLPRRIVAHTIPSPGTELAALTKDVRRAAARAVCRVPLTVTATAGYEKAEVTAGGVDLAEVQRRTLESLKAPGMYLCGEVLDATGRLGGFNFQWAWASGFLAGRGAARGLESESSAPTSD